MKKGLATAMVCVLSVGCGDATGVEVDDLVGTWTATQYVFTSVADATVSADLVAQGGSYSITIGMDSTFSTSFLEPGEAMETRIGTVNVVGQTLTIAESGQGSPTAFQASRDGDAMTLNTADEDYDFDDDGNDDAATLRIELVRN